MSRAARRYERNSNSKKRKQEGTSQHQPKHRWEEDRHERASVKVAPLTNKQKLYQTMLENMTLIVADGVAGTGKSFLPCHHAAQLMLADKIKKIALVRPYTSVANKGIGFLKGTVEDKLMPYMLPMLGYLRDALGSATVDIMIADKRIEIVSLDSIRGRSFSDTYVIADEMQTSLIAEMQALTTRIGENTTLVIAGDARQDDIKKGENGLQYIKRILDKYDIRDSGVIEFGMEDIVRSGICYDFCVAYESEGWE